MELRGCLFREVAENLTQDARADLGRIVVDRTGLQGRYNLSLRWTPSSEDALASYNSNDPFLFTAIKQQLGLELKPIRGEVDTLEIDHIEMPSEN